MSDVTFFLIWVTMIIGGVVIILTAMTRRQKIIEMSHRERMAMIERGMVPPANSPDPITLIHSRIHRGDTRSRMLSGGIVVIAFGLGLMMMIGIAGESPESALGIGGAIAVIGAAFVVIAIVQRYEPFPPPPSPPPYVPPQNPSRRDNEL